MVVNGQPRTPQPGKRASVQGRSRCSSMDGVLSCRPVLRPAQRRGPTEEQAGGQQSDGQPAGQLHNLIAQKMQRAQELLEEMRLQELQKAERGRGGEHPYPRGVDSPRLHHLRASDSSHSRSPGSPRSRSSDSPRLRGKDSPRQRGRESPRSRAKKNHRSKGNESQKPTESPRVLRVTASPRSTCAKSAAAPPGDPERPTDSCLPPDRLDGDSPKVSKSSESCQKAASSPCGSSDSESPPLLQRSFPALQSRKNFPSLSKSFDLPHPGSPAASPVSKTSLKDLLRQRSFDSSSPRSTLPSSSSSFSSSRPCQLSEEEESEVERRRAEAEHLLEEAVMSWREAQEVLQEVRDLQSRTLRRQRRQTYDKTMSSSPPTTPPPPSAETDIGLPMATAGGADGEEEEEEEEMEEEDPSILLTSPEDDQSEMA